MVVEWGCSLRRSAPWQIKDIQAQQAEILEQQARELEAHANALKELQKAMRVRNAGDGEETAIMLQNAAAHRAMLLWWDMCCHYTSLFSGAYLWTMGVQLVS